MRGPRVAPDMLVRVSYRLYDEDGQLADDVTQDAPLAYVHGFAQVIPGLERGLEGARAGEQRSLLVAPEDGFGLRDEEALLEIDRHDFPDAAAAQLGDELAAVGPNGEEVSYRVMALSADSILADLNHPLAGQTVRFEVRVLAVRPASDEELDAAHADMDERIVYDGTIVYASEPAATASATNAMAPNSPSTSSGLVQLRTKDKVVSET